MYVEKISSHWPVLSFFFKKGNQSKTLKKIQQPKRSGPSLKMRLQKF